MSKIKSAFFCQSCGYEAAKWLGKCPSCSEWNTFVEEMIEKPSKNVIAFSNENIKNEVNKKYKAKTITWDTILNN